VIEFSLLLEVKEVEEMLLLKLPDRQHREFLKKVHRVKR